MKRMWLVAIAAGCSTATTAVPPVASPAAVVATAAPAIVPPAATRHHVDLVPVSLSDRWGSERGSNLDLVALPGGYASLDDVCAELAAGSDPPAAPSPDLQPCTSSSNPSFLDAADRGDGSDDADAAAALAALASPFTTTGALRVWHDGSDTEAQGLDVRDESVAVAVRDRWYVLPGFADIGNRYSSLGIDAELAGDALVLHYDYDESTGGRFASTTESGVVVCKAIGNAVACTGKIVTARFDRWMDTNKDGWPSFARADLACDATYANGTLTVGPMAKPADDEPVDNQTWSPSAAAACTSLPYAGTHAIAP